MINTLFAITSFLTAAASFLLGIFVVSKNWKNWKNRMWFFTTIAISIWSFSLAMEVSSPNYNTALFWNKILNIGAIFIPIFFYHFIVLFLEKKEKEKTYIIIGYLFAFLLLSFNLFSSLFVKGVPPSSGLRFWIEVGPLYYFFFGFFVIYFLRIIYLLFKERKKSEDIKRAQINYLLIAILFGFGGGIMNFIPQVFSVNIFPFGNFLVVLYAFFITYSVLRHHLFHSHVIATELFTLAILIFLFFRVLIAKDFQDLLVNAGLLVVISIFSGLLVRSVLREVKQREKLEKMTEEIKKAYEIEKKAHHELQGLSEAKNQFIMATQHHLRTPLTSIMGYIDLILSGTYGKVPKKMKDAIIKLQTSTKRLIRIVNEILDISQFQLGKQVVDVKPGVDMEAVVDEIAEELNFEAKSKEIDLKLKKPKEKLPKIKADEEKIKVALFNLVDNAVKYTAKGGVSINIETTDHSLRIAIKDTGIGIEKEELPKLFSKIFERGKKAKKVFTTGRGIGLFISSRIIRAHNGKVWAESEGKGKGSTFFVELPVK